MSRGKRIVSNNGSEWEQVFYKTVGTYVQYINVELGKIIQSVSLSKHIRIVGGYSFNSSEYLKKGIPIIRISDFSNEKIIVDNCVYYRESKELSRYELKEGEIIIALTGGTIGKLAIVQKGLGKLYLNQRVGKFEVLFPDEFEAEYIYWIAKGIEGIIKDLGWGTAIPNVSPKQIEALTIPFPDKLTQKGIIKFLNDLKNNCLNESIEYFNKTVENKIIVLQESQVLGNQLLLEHTNQLNYSTQLRRTFLREAFQGKLVSQDFKDEPAGALLKKIIIEKERLIKEGKLKKSKPLSEIQTEDNPYDIPNSWKWCRLADITKLITDGKHGDCRNSSDSGYYFLSAKDIQNGKLIYEKARQICYEDFLEVHNRTNLEPGDLCVVNTGATVGKSAITINNNLTSKTTFQKSVAVIKIMNTFINIDYINYLIHYETPMLFKMSWGTAINNLLLGDMKAMPIPLPPLNEQNRIVDKLKILMQICDELESQRQLNQEVTKLILQSVLKEALKPKKEEFV